MKFTKTIELNIGDGVEVSTTDGWMFGQITDFIENKIRINVPMLETTLLYSIDDIKI